MAAPKDPFEKYPAMPKIEPIYAARSPSPMRHDPKCAATDTSHAEPTVRLPPEILCQIADELRATAEGGKALDRMACAHTDLFHVVAQVRLSHVRKLLTQSERAQLTQAQWCALDESGRHLRALMRADTHAWHNLEPPAKSPRCGTPTPRPPSFYKTIEGDVQRPAFLGRLLRAPSDQALHALAEMDARIDAAGLSAVRAGLTAWMAHEAQHTASAHVESAARATLAAYVDQEDIIDLGHHRLTTLPDVLCHIPSLRVMILAHNRLLRLPAECAKLTKLVHVDLCDNQLVEAPNVLATLPALRHLELGHNRITHVDHEMGFAKTLRYLSLRANELASLPEHMHGLDHLEHLDLSHNQLAVLPAAVTHLVGLRQLHLEGNQLSDLPDSVAQLRALQELNLAHNRFEACPAAVGALPLLKHLSLANNRLTALPSALSALHHTECINLSHNRLTHVPPVLGSMPRLDTLYMQNNRISFLPGLFAKISHLRRIDLRHNPIARLGADWSASHVEVRVRADTET